MRKTLELLYQEVITDHYHNPRNKGVLEMPTFSSMQHNPSCGDSISWQGVIKGGVITQVKFQGTGCVISQATASLLSEVVINKNFREIEELDAEFIMKLIGITVGPTRLKCALLSLEALKDGLRRP